MWNAILFHRADGQMGCIPVSRAVSRPVTELAPFEFWGEGHGLLSVGTGEEIA